MLIKLLDSVRVINNSLQALILLNNVVFLKNKVVYNACAGLLLSEFLA